jgi:hypothetical protein
MDHSLTDCDNPKVLRVQGELDALSSPELRPTLARDGEHRHLVGRQPR